MRLSQGALTVINTLMQHGYEAYAVGGCVRDSIMGKIPKDWDICTLAHPNSVMDLFAHDNNYRVIETGLKHGTVTVLIGSEPIEVTTYRVDGKYENNRKPSQVSFVSSLKEDLARRDFTMNALAYSPHTGIIDYYGGQSHIKEKIIKSVGNPNHRICEDALRILRALRFSSKYGFSIDNDLANSIHKHKDLLLNISSERIQNEWGGILLGMDSAKVLSQYKDVIGTFIPEVKDMFGFEQNNPYHHLDVWEHTLESVQVAADNLVVKLSMFLHDIGKPASYTVDDKKQVHFYGHANKSVNIAKIILNRLKYSNQITSDVLILIKYHDIVLSEKNLLRWMNKIGKSRVSLLLDVMTADIKAQSPDFLEDRMNQLTVLRQTYNQIIEENRCFNISGLKINGKDLIDLGYSQGKEIGKNLNYLLTAVMEEKVENNKEALIEYLQES